MTKDLMVRSSSAEFLVFKINDKEKNIQVRYENDTLWMTQKAMAELFDVEQPAIAKHLINISKEKELDKLIKENEGSLRKIQNFYSDQAQRVLKLTPKPQEIHTAA